MSKPNHPTHSLLRPLALGEHSNASKSFNFSQPLSTMREGGVAGAEEPLSAPLKTKTKEEALQWEHTKNRRERLAKVFELTSAIKIEAELNLSCQVVASRAGWVAVGKVRRKSQESHGAMKSYVRGWKVFIRRLEQRHRSIRAEDSSAGRKEDELLNIE